MSSLSNEQLLDGIRWMNSGDCGLSSEAMLSAATTGETNRYNEFSYPHDPADIGRCFRLCLRLPWVFERAEPVLRERGGPVWAALLDHWNELHALMDGEVGVDWLKGRSAERTYDRMRQIIRGARV